MVFFVKAGFIRFNLRFGKSCIIIKTYKGATQGTMDNELMPGPKKCIKTVQVFIIGIYKTYSISSSLFFASAFNAASSAVRVGNLTSLLSTSISLEGLLLYWYAFARSK